MEWWTWRPNPEIQPEQCGAHAKAHASIGGRRRRDIRAAVFIAQGRILHGYVFIVWSYKTKPSLRTSARDCSWPIVLIRRHVTLELEADLGAVSDIDATTSCR